MCHWYRNGPSSFSAGKSKPSGKSYVQIVLVETMFFLNASPAKPEFPHVDFPKEWKWRLERDNKDNKTLQQRLDLALGNSDDAALYEEWSGKRHPNMSNLLPDRGEEGKKNRTSRISYKSNLLQRLLEITGKGFFDSTKSTNIAYRHDKVKVDVRDSGLWR